MQTIGYRVGYKTKGRWEYTKILQTQGTESVADFINRLLTMGYEQVSIKKIKED